MALKVEAAFDHFYNDINLTGDHREISNSRKESIITYLKKSLHILEVFPMGSIPKFTALKDKADLDIVVALDFYKHINGKHPKQVLQEVRDCLGDYKTNVRKNGQAVTLYYKTWPNVDVVPVVRHETNGLVSHYSVPNANTGEWIKSQPKAHYADIEQKASKCGPNFRKIIKLVKWWNMAHGDYLQSYHIEVLALKIFNGNLDDLLLNIYTFFNKAKDLLLFPLWHNTSYVDSYLESEDRKELLKRIDDTITKTALAWNHTHKPNNADHKSALLLWKQIFGDKFPNYG